MFRKGTTNQSCNTSANTSALDGSRLSNESSSKNKRYRTQTSKNVWVGRTIFVVSLMVVAGVLGYAGYALLSRSETELTEAQFTSIADRAVECMMNAMRQKRKGASTLADVIGSAHPHADEWPLVALQNFEGVASDLTDISKGCLMAFCPIVPVAQMGEFEDFAYNYFRNRVPEPFPEGTGESSFGRGVFAIDKKLNTTDKRFHNTEAKVMWGNSTNEGKFVTPMLHHSTGASKKLMMDLHAMSSSFGPMIDNMLECSKLREEENNLGRKCAAITPLIANKTLFVQQVVQQVQNGPGASFLMPVYPVNDPFKAVGFVGTSIVWGELLVSAFAPAVSGVDVVLRSGDQAYTFSISNGESKLKNCSSAEDMLPGEGDCHDKSYDSYAFTTLLTPPDEYCVSSSGYSMTVYPNKEIFAVYSTRNPFSAMIGAVLIVLLMGVFFLVFDRCVRKEFDAKTDLLEAKRKFVAFVSHEVRTPLNSVCMGLQLMREEMGASIAKREPAGPETMAEWSILAEEVLVNAGASVDVLNDLLNYDKVETGTLTLELTVIPIISLLRQTLDEFKLPAAKKKLNYTVKIPETDALRDSMCVGDKVRLCQVIRNLVSNAIKFTPESGDLSVRVSLMDKTIKSSEQAFELHNGNIVTLSSMGSLRIEVADSGTGMTKDQLKRVFQRGTQFNVNELQAGQGSGLGLFIAKGIIEQHGGSLAVDSAGIGLGTTFAVTCPIYRDTESGTADKDESESEYPLNDSGRCALLEPAVEIQNILVVEDAPMNLKLMTRLLQKQGHKVDGAENGEIGVRKVKEAMEAGNPYDTILMDNCMPVMDGITASKHIRAMGGDSFIVGVTGNMMAEDVEAFKGAGANAVLPKPFKMTSLETLWNEQGFGNCRKTQREEKTDGDVPFLLFDEELGLPTDRSTSNDSSDQSG